MIFNANAVPVKWYDAADDLIDHNRHMTEDIGSAKWWTYHIRYEVAPYTYMFQVKMYLTLPGLVSQLDYYAGSEMDIQNASWDAANIHDDLAVHMATYVDNQIMKRGHH